MRHVYSGDVEGDREAARASTFGEAYNLCMDETPTLPEVLELIASLLGAPARLAPIPSAALRARGIDPVAMSPFSDRWMSLLDPAKAKAELGFQHTPLRRWLETVITSLLANPPSSRRTATRSAPTRSRSRRSSPAR